MSLCCSLALLVGWVASYFFLELLWGWYGRHNSSFLDFAWINTLVVWMPGLGAGAVGGFAVGFYLRQYFAQINRAVLRLFPYLVVITLSLIYFLDNAQNSTAIYNPIFIGFPGLLLGFELALFQKVEEKNL